MAQDGPLVSTDWLAEHLEAPDIRIVDASWHMPDTGRDARAEYREAHVPGAVFFDIDDIADTDSSLPHMVPSPEKFASRVRKLGLGDGNRIIVYDTGGVHPAARVWWMFRLFGSRDVAVLDGGLRKWRAEGRPLDDLPPVPRERHFTARLQVPLIRDRHQVLRHVERGDAQIADTRPADRFDGSQPEPREGVRAGHMPGAKNLPFDRLFNPDGTYKTGAALKAELDSAGIDPSRPLVTSCGSGVTACCLALSLATLGARDVAVYDGSWTDWGSHGDLPVEQGSAA
ncbi:MAG: 3-mercaptopyruvate sulfurtransferase [Rhodothalassiaceae bacterium]